MYFAPEASVGTTSLTSSTSRDIDSPMSDQSSIQLDSKPKIWTRDQYSISTDKSLLQLDAINSAFATDYMYWTNPLPQEVLQQVIDGSFCFGIYQNLDDTTTRQQLGFARLITDHTTFAYLTDVYVLPEHRGLGIGGWLLDCIDEHLEAKPYLRWTMLRTGRLRSRELYQNRQGYQVLESGTGEFGPWMMGKKGRGNMA